jgi:hypothetical protein
MVEEAIGHSVEHMHQEFSPLGAGWGEVHFEEPWVQLLVQHEVETINLKTVGAVLDTSLLTCANGFDDYFFNALSHFFTFFWVVFKGFLEKFLLTHNEVFGLVCNF